MTRNTKESFKKLIRAVVGPIGYDVVRVKKYNPQEERQITRNHFFDLYFSKIDPKNFFFVQIGANDGKTNDPIHPYIVKYGLSGVVVEPQSDVFPLLKDAYKNFPTVRCINAAISDKTGNNDFYVVKDIIKTEDNFPRLTGIATFNKDVLRRTLKKKLPKGASVDDYIEKISIKTFSFNDLVKDIKKIDMVQIDCEGYDYEILKMIDLEKFSPTLINFESSHLSDKDRKECEILLENNGYKWFRYGSDTCAYKP